MVSENHPNKCPHICLYLIFKQQTCRSGRSLAGGVTPAKAAHYTYRLKPCKPFLKKSFGARSGSRNGVETAARGGDVNNSPSGPQGNESGIFRQFAAAAHSPLYTVNGVGFERGGIAITGAPQRPRHKPAPHPHRSAPAKTDAARPGLLRDR